MRLSFTFDCVVQPLVTKLITINLLTSAVFKLFRARSHRMTFSDYTIYTKKWQKKKASLVRWPFLGDKTVPADQSILWLPSLIHATWREIRRRLSPFQFNTWPTTNMENEAFGKRDNRGETVVIKVVAFHIAKSEEETGDAYKSTHAR